MGMLKRLTALLTAAVLLCGMRPAPANAAGTVVYHGITGLPFSGGDPFKGVDVSSAISLENSGVVFRGRDGQPQDLFKTLAQAGVNTVRVRIWNDPYNAAGENYGGGICDRETAVQIAKRCADEGLKLLVDFHYSDFWADPGKQRAPKAWANYSVSQKADAIYSFTLETLQTLAKTGAEIAMVQVGNETTTGMCGELLSNYNWSAEGWQALASLFNAGARAVRAFSSKTLVAVHFTNPEKASNMAYLAKSLSDYRVDYDVFATSYYPYWHGTLSNLTSVLSDIAKSYGKQVLVAETSWVRTFDDADVYGNTISGSDKLGDYVSYDVSVSGQCSYLYDVFSAVAAVPDGKGIGVFYWEPAWLPVGSNYSGNQALWEKYGSGWANKAAGEFDTDARDYYGGSCVDNESLFSADGTPLDSLYVFGTVHGDGQQTDSTDSLLKNPGFENDGAWTDSPAGWRLHSTADGHFDVRAEDARSGGYALHWYSEGAFADSTAEASAAVAEAGQYVGTVSLQADESTSWTLTLRSSGGAEKTVSGKGSGWAQWVSPAVSLRAEAGETLTLTLTVSGGAGSYGSADDFELRAAREGDHIAPEVHLERDSVTLHRNERFEIRADRGALTYESSDRSIAEVGADGKILAHAPGEAVIAVFADGERVGAVTVTVLADLTGDLDLDGTVGRSDVDLLLGHLLTKHPLDAETAERADLDANGRIDARDLTLLKRLILK